MANCENDRCRTHGCDGVCLRQEASQHQWVVPCETAATRTLERMGYEWRSLDGKHYDWYSSAPAQPVRAVDGAALRGAIARAYCNPLNSSKTMDPDLIEAAVAEVETLLATPTQPDPQSASEAQRMIEKIEAWLHARFRCTR